MAATKRLVVSRRTAPSLAARIQNLWANAGIRTRILVPLLLLMLLSVLGSTVSFILSTNATRNQLLDDQLADDVQRVSAALARSEQSLLESAQLLAGDARLAPLLRADDSQHGGDTLLDLDRRALGVLVRYRLDQVLIANAAGKPRANIAAQSALSQFSDAERTQLLAQTRESSTVLLPARDARRGWVLIARAAVRDSTGPAGSPGTVYTVLNVAEELGRIRRDLQLSADMQLASGGVPVASTLDAAPPLTPPVMQLAIDGRAYRAAWHALQLGARPLDLAVLRSEATIDATVSSGLRAMLISSGLTLVLLASCGVWVASSITRPILHLSRVAGEVAAGNLSSKAGLRQRDEVGQLGRALDQATTTISSLLAQQAQITGERQAILNSIADGVLAVDRDKRIVLINPAAATLLGLADQAVQHQPLAELARSPDATIGAGVQLLVELIEESLGGEETHGEQRVVLGQRVVRVHSAPVVGGEQRNGAVVVLQDVTRAVEADRAKSEFIAVASHELRTPLTGLKGFVDLLALDGVAHLTRMQLECLAAIRRQTDNLVLLVNDLLEMARLEQGARAERQWVSPAYAIDDALVGVQVQANAKRLRIERVVSAELSPLWIDERHLHRILSNLVSNAVKYTPDGGRVVVRAYALEDPAQLPAALAVQAWPHHGPESLMLAVEDTGVGIRSDDQWRVFSRFFRSANALSVEAGGTGLGLAITQALVALHGGQIGFHSVEGQGSCFWVRLPVQLTAAIALAPPAEHL